jgi:small subunit ribosomal protein S8
MITDPISDMLTRIRNASMVKKHKVDIPLSKVKFAISKILESQGYVEGVEVIEVGKRQYIRATLKYDQNKAPAISSIQRISKPGRRIYVKSNELPVVKAGYGFAIVSTPNGLMTNLEAKKRRLGGELICEIF